MKPEDKDRQALDALLQDAGRDMTDEDLDRMIDRELDKGEQMDADLVSEALAGRETEDSEDAQARNDANWRAIERKLDAREHAPWKRHTHWMQAVAAVIAVGMVISLGLATEAGRWESLVRIFQPFVEETLGIHLNAGNPASDGKVQKEAVTTAPDDTVPVDAAESVTIRDESKAPKTVGGYNAVPSWIPEGFKFQYAQVFEDSFESSQTTAYKRADVELFVQTVVYMDAKTAINVIEKDAERDDLKKIAIIDNEGVVSATYENNLACYMVWGRLSREEISQVITSLIGAG